MTGTSPIMFSNVLKLEVYTSPSKTQVITPAEYK